MRNAWLVGSWLVASAGAVATAEPVSLDAWFQGPRLSQVALSPDGRYLALIVRDGPQSYVAVKDRSKAEPAKPVIVPDPKQEILPRVCGWAGPSRLACRLTGYTARPGDGSFVSRLMAVDADGGNPRLLLNEEPRDQAGTLADQMQVIAWNTGDGESMLVAGYLPRATGVSVGRVNTRNGSLRIVARPQNPIRTFSSDHQGNVLFAAGIPDTLSKDKKVHYFGRTSNDAEWSQLKRLLPYADSPFRLLSVTPGEPSAHVLLNHDGRMALYKVDLTDQRDPELVFWHEKLDLSLGLYDGAGKLLGVYFDSNWVGPQYFDTRVQALDTALRKNWPNRWNWVVGGSHDGKVMVVRATSVSEPTGFHVLDTSGGGVRFDAVGYEWPGFARRTLPATEPAPLRSRKGQVLDVLFTPAARTNGKAPLVVFTDGAQITGGFEPATYFLATRGYAVLRPYFSGTRVQSSSTYASYYDWNGRHLEELQDAVAWASQRPDVDASRICIVGRGGHGGYTALLAAARPDTPFRCAASFMGYSSLLEPRADAVKANLIANEKPEGVSEEILEREAPSGRASEVRVPVLLVEDDTSTHSGRDYDDGREMAAALKAAKKPHKLLLIRETGDEYQRAAYAELERFLAAHLK
jgi:dipeptidyl aminopeptidase/acylaminoacyl peptidase